jgi:hypothetical protein
MPTTVKKQIETWVALVLGTTLLSFISILFAPSSAPAEPSISWSPTSVTETILASETKKVAASFTASENIGNASVRVVPELQPYVQVSPSSFSSVAKGQTVNLIITISSTATSLPGTFDGTIQLRNASGKNQKTFARPLPVTISLQWATFGDQDVEIMFSYPPNLSPNVKTSDPDDPGQFLIKRISFLQAPGADDPGSFYINVYVNQLDLSLEGFVNDVLLNDYPDDVITNAMHVSGYEGLQYRTNAGHRIDTFVKRGGTIISIEWPDLLSPNDKDVAVYNQFLNSIILP